MRFLFALPGFHHVDRGAEVALLAVADELARTGDSVTVMGMGPERPGTAYAYRHVPAVDRRKLEWLPKVPPFRSDTGWEDATFAFNLTRAFRPTDFDFTVTCNFPFTHWALRRSRGGYRPLHLFVTQNGDWAAHSDAGEFRYFACDGLVCTNPDFEARNRDRWRTALIPNGIDPSRYRDVAADRAGFGLPEDRPVVLMVSALIDTKRVLDGMRAVAALPGVHFAVAGDGPLRQQVDALAAEILPGRFTRMTLTADRMPALYRSADVFLHMSLQEAFGNVYVEAMASGLPIVGHDSSRLRWIVGARETLCDTEDAGALAAALGQALQTGQGTPDPRAEQFAWPSIAASYRRFAAELLSERGRA
ncbi:MAG: glycosyl transferase family 1 [Sphingomonadales bacterium 32-68-7]|nr:MAG: glycosyl transferase family 1 [Sphingomonadales bacterium 12-68-11]OYX10599.1 MAG: glycosyl transferase family 1 [Sphingomonadales bacterium 32-68-7]